METTDLIPVDLGNGKQLPLRAIQAKGNGKTYWATLATKADKTRYFSRYGVKVSSNVVGSSLPTTITVLGKQFAVEQDTTERDQQRVRASGPITVPGHGPKVLNLRITQLTESTFNVSASIRGAGQSTAVDEL